MDYISYGSAPVEEECAQVGTDDYYERVKEESSRFITLLREIFGPEPNGARLKVKSFPHDFGTYHEVVCTFDDEVEEAVNYAYTIEGNLPATWNG